MINMRSYNLSASKLRDTFIRGYLFSFLERKKMKSRWIPDEDYKKILSYLSDRDRSIVKLLRYSGYRVDDVLYSRIYPWTKSTVTLHEAKTGKVRTVPVTPAMQLIVHDLAGDRPKLSYLIPTRRKHTAYRRKIHRTTVWRHFQKAVHEAELDGKGYTLHSLRKCYAVDLLRRTGRYEAVQADLGHKYLSTTLLYLQDALTLL